MTLTDKTKEDFDKWYIEMLRKKPDIQNRYWDENLLSFFERSDDTMRNAYIVEWLDTVGIYILTDFIIDEFDCEIKHYLSENEECKKIYLSSTKTRNEAISSAIEKANEIYNEKYGYKMDTKDFINSIIGNMVYIVGDHDLAMDGELRELIVNKTELRLIKWTKGGNAYLHDEVGNMYYSVPPSNVKQIIN